MNHWKWKLSSGEIITVFDHRIFANEQKTVIKTRPSAKSCEFFGFAKTFDWKLIPWFLRSHTSRTWLIFSQIRNPKKIWNIKQNQNMFAETNFETAVWFILKLTFNVFDLKRYYVFMIVGCCSLTLFILTKTWFEYI